MIAILLGTATLLLLTLVLSRRLFPEFRRRSELPKYQFLETLGIPCKKEEKS